MEQIDDLVIYFIDALAGGYGWGKEEILDLFIEEILEYIRLIKTRETRNYITLLAISHNPHVKEPKKLSETLEKQLKKLEKRDIMGAEKDKDAMQKLKQIFNKKR